ncbi:hypothetical protein V499_09747 [Pseudogymnoascus sp. VKM F-103]|nr:hypothetical protein V499_09747 [Pseudogymnoascus sp. VKM F-103]
MSDSKLPPYGQFCWLEVPVTDIERAKDFYTSVFNWECSPQGSPSPLTGARDVIHMFTKGGLHGAFVTVAEDCMVKAYDEKSPGKAPVLPTFCVESIEETLKVVESKGGRLHVPKTDIGGGMGFFARFIDSEGNLQGIWAQN